jgi:predicted RNA methylase
VTAFTLLSSANAGEQAIWRGDDDDAPPGRVALVDDRLTADGALRRARRGEYLLYVGDYRNARQLLDALGRRAGRARKGAPRSVLEAFRQERAARAREHQVLSRLLVSLDAEYQLKVRRAPAVDAACRLAWGEPSGTTVVPLNTLLGVVGAGEWHEKGIPVPGLKGRLHPGYGVFLPTRSEYLELILQAPSPTGKRVFDVGTGTGVLAFIMLQRGAVQAVATDVDPRAISSAQADATRLKLADRFEVVERELFPEGKADLIVCNPPWIPEVPRTRLDRAVFDPESRFLLAFLAGVREHLAPAGEAYLFQSDLAELIGLRPREFLEQAFQEAGLEVAWTKTAPAKHPRSKDESDPLYAARSREMVSLYCLVPAGGS